MVSFDISEGVDAEAVAVRNAATENRPDRRAVFQLGAFLHQLLFDFHAFITEQGDASFKLVEFFADAFGFRSIFLEKGFVDGQMPSSLLRCLFAVDKVAMR